MPGLIQRLQAHQVTTSPTKILQSAGKKAPPFKIDEVLPRLKEGGAFVKFTKTTDEFPLTDIESRVKAHLEENPIRPIWWPFQRVHANLVKGRPWVEDLYRMPSTKLKVEFLPAHPGVEAAEISQEQLYSVFRPYGKLSEIASQPPDSKVLPKFAYIYFTATRRAIMAKNCLHGLVVPETMGGGQGGTLLRLAYEQKSKDHWIKDWLFNHPRIVIPAIAAIVAGVTVVVFDP